MYAAETISPPIASRHSWSPEACFGFRLMVVYAALYLLPQWLFLLIRALNWVPGALSLGTAFGNAWQSIDVWVARHTLGVGTPIDLHTLGTGSGDTLLSYMELLWQSSVAVAAASVWTVFDARRIDSDELLNGCVCTSATRSPRSC